MSSYTVYWIYIDSKLGIKKERRVWMTKVQKGGSWHLLMLLLKSWFYIFVFYFNDDWKTFKVSIIAIYCIDTDSLVWCTDCNINSSH